MGSSKRDRPVEATSNSKRSRNRTRTTIDDSQKKISLFFAPANKESSSSSSAQQPPSCLTDVTNSQHSETDEKETKKPQGMSLGDNIQEGNTVDDGAAVLSKETPFFETSMYTDEFNTMLSTVLDGERHLFCEDEIRLFDTYKALSAESQHLFVRLWMRKQRWHRLGKLEYHRHVSDIQASTTELCHNGLVSTQLESIEDALALLTIDELKMLAKEQQITVEPNKKRTDYVRALKAPSRTGWKGTVFQFIGTCVMVKQNVYAVFKRLHLVYYRLNNPTSTESPMSSAILARISRRNYPHYVTMRSTNIWTSRQELLAYEEAFNVYRNFEDRMAEAFAAERGSKEHLLRECWMLAENYVGVWEEQINDASKKKTTDRPYYLRRFEAGWMYTHMLEHGTQILARLQEYELESIILRKLLDQSLYRIGKRGEWYNRLALVQALHLKSRPERERKKQALATCIEAIQDPRVHQIYLNKLQWRIQKLERDLSVPRREQHDFSYMTLRKPQEQTIYGERVSDSVTGYKSVWRSDDGAECSVEQVAIQYYSKKGYKGLHTESGIVSMLFMLLMWDVIFAPMPGVFETPYQTAPMDLWTDAFYVGRAGMINERLNDIGQGKYLEIIKCTDERERARETYCVGVQWQYERQDLLEIAECIGPGALSSLCKLFAEEFGHRRGGMPDLCCWNYEEKTCLFVEVKGPGDKLSEMQKLWIDTLAAFGVPVEVCHVKVWQGDDVLLGDGESS